MNILDEIADRTRERVAEQKLIRSLESIRAAAEEARRHDCDGCNAEEPGLSAEEFASARLLAPCSFPFEGMLQQPGVQVIAEVKRACPSKGLIAPNFPYLQIARDYEAAGAAAISCVTEPYWFQGRDEYLAEIAREVRIPVLRKDFVVDEYMVYQAKTLGARAVHLICAILDDAQLKAYRQLADELQMSTLVEAHTAREVGRAIACGARVISVNARDPKTFETNMATARELRDMVPPYTTFVLEGGVKTAADVAVAREMRADAVFVGEALMRAEDKRAKLAELLKEAQ